MSTVSTETSKLLRAHKKQNIYLDHAATTPMNPAVKTAMDPYFCEKFGNPSAFYEVGLQAQDALEESRGDVAKILDCNPREIIFCGSGTESDNLAVLGVARAYGKGHIITSAIEHHAVLDPVLELENEGFEVTVLPVNKDGLVEAQVLKKAIRKDTILVSIMYSNNEIGTVQPIADLSKVCRDKGVLFHTDACQAGCYLDLNVKNLGVDLMTLNGSKIYGPKGVGCLYIRSGVKIKPITWGGGQERGLRSGTHNVPGIVGFAKALTLAQKNREKESKRLEKLRDKLIHGLENGIPKCFLNGDAQNRLPNNVNMTVLDIEGEAVILFLNELGVYASTGSACTSASLDPSHVITALGLPYEAAHGSIRFTLGHSTTSEDIDFVLKIMPKITEILRRISPLNLEAKKIQQGQCKLHV
ncbi:MAG: cysteine desulfurase family protein [Patescibacteria group bacterium]|nr:cysteine desulfurase [Patescibacteria group bacterium]